MNEEVLSNLIVIKRTGKKVNFDGTKIAIAIKKGFDSIEGKYNEDDVNKVYNKVIGKIVAAGYERIQIEKIQDIIEMELQSNGYQDVYESFADYREKRNQSREIFFEEKRKHKFLKALEKLGLTTKEGSDEVETHQNTTEAMESYGSTVAEEFATSYLMKKRFADAHENADICINKLEYYPMGTTESCQIDLEKLFTDGFNAGNSSMREPQSISSYTTLALVALASNQKDQNKEESIPAFDYYMAPGVLKTFKKVFRETIYDVLEFTDYDKFIAINGIEREIEKLSTIGFDIEQFYKFTRESDQLKRMFRIVYKTSMEKTAKYTFQAMEGLVHDINSFCGSRVTTINLGTDVRDEGRMVTKSLLQAIEDGIGQNQEAPNPKIVFKIKKGVNSSADTKNYDLLEMACKIAVKTNNISFSNLDASFNSQFYKEGDYNTEIAYFSDGVRVIDNYIDREKEVVGGRGVISSTIINLPRIALKHKNDVEGFEEELQARVIDVKDQLLERLEIQSNKHVYNFPFLMQQHVWFDSERLKEDDKVRRILKQGNMIISFTGLYEALKLLLSDKEIEGKKAQEVGLKIVSMMRNLTEEFSKKYALNFTLAGNEDATINKNFLEVDRVIFGKVKGVTDKEAYTSAFELPSDVEMTKKIKWEAPFHELLNGGHLAKIKIDSSKTLKDKDSANSEKAEKLMKMIEDIIKSDIGYFVISKK